MKGITLAVCALLALSGVLSKPTKGTDKKVVCYYGSWAVYRPGAGRFPVEEIDPFICTHLVYGFAGLSSSNTIRSLDPWQDLADDYGKDSFGRFNKLKQINPSLKTILAIGGWNEGSTKYSAMASNAGTRKTFVDSVVTFLDKYNFDGLDMDWEYPANRGGKPEDKQNFVLLLKELREAFDSHGFLLTAAVSAGKATIDTAYDIPQVSRYLDFINLMTYDFHGAWESFTGHNSPLYALPTETPEQQLLNMNFSVNYWIEKGAPREKIILGMGLYGRGFTLQRAEDNGLFATSNTPSTPGPYTREPGILGFNEICEKFGKETWTVVQQDHYLAPYAFRDRQWVGYDDKDSIRTKSEYGKKMGLGGGMVWSIETDDFHGTCYGHRYPLLTIIHEVFIGDIARPSIPTEDPFHTRPPVTSVTRPPYTGPPVTSPTGRQCTSEGWFRDPNDCASYWWCFLQGNQFRIQEFHCESGTVFDLNTNTCNWPNNVPGC